MLSNLKIGNFSIQDILGRQSKGYLKIAEPGELEINEMKSLKVKGKDILLCRSERGYSALQVKCTHKNNSLTKGILISGTIVCLHHGCQFDAASGNVKKGPAKRALRKYTIFEKEHGIFLKF
jgi:nitrite reductase/ring-hydroxylating ferredoxin subunit